MSETRFLILALALTTTTACSNDLPKPQLLDRLRVLALVADQPEVSPGGSVTIEPFISDVRGGGRAMSYTVEGCRDPGLDYGAGVSCEHDSAKQSLGPTAVTLTAPRYTNAAPTFSITVPATLFADAKTDTRSQFNGANYLVIFTLTAADGEVERAFRRIKVSGATKVAKNANPTFSGFTDENGTTVTSLPTAEVSLLSTAGAGSDEQYTELKLDGTTETRTETLTVSWFASEGELADAVQAVGRAVKYTPATSTTYSHFIIAVVRDERGGAVVSSPLIP
jgi:hypothetical protein